MRRALLFLMLLSLAFASDGSQQVELDLRAWLDLLQGLLVPMMFLLIVAAGAVYVVGQFFGQELRARASVYASSLITAAGIGALVLILFFFFLPFFEARGDPRIDLVAQIGQLASFAETALVVLVGVLVVVSAVTYALGRAASAETRARATVWATGMLGGAIVAAVLYVILNQILPAFGAALTLPYGLDIYVRQVIIPVVFLVSFILIITYLLSKVFKVPEWEAYLSVELSQLMNSFLVILFIVGLFGVGEVIVASMTDVAYSPPIAAAQFLREWVADGVMTGMYDIFRIQICTSILSTFSRRIGEFVLTNVYKVFPGTDTFVSISNVLAFGLVSVYGSISFQIIILTLIDSIAVPLLLPAGLLLRFFPPTRDAGSFLISMAFAFQLVFPMTLLIHEQVLEDIGAHKYNSPTLLIASVCGPFKYGVFGVLLNPATNPLFSGPIMAPVPALMAPMRCY